MKDLEILKKAVEVLRRGELIVYPTDTVYGLGGDGTSEEAVKKVFELKKRPSSMPISVLVSDLEMLEKYAEINEEQKKILKEKLPGPYTFILKPKIKLPVAEGNVGFRMPDHWCTLLSKEFGKPITSTSANIHKQPTPENIAGIEASFGDSVPLYIDEGTKQGKPSKIVDLTQGFKVIRE